MTIQPKLGESPEEFFRRLQNEKSEALDKFGHVREQVGADYAGHRIQAVGNRIYGFKGIRTFHDFLVGYQGEVFGREWMGTQMALPVENQHYVATCALRFFEWQSAQKPNIDGMYAEQFSASAAIFMLLAYDLYVLQHHQALQSVLVRRMKNPNGFQGARYELSVFSSLIRADFTIAYEDETDGLSKHVELVATHKVTGESIAVEAKSRHRHGIQGFKDEKAKPLSAGLGITALISDALAKPAKHPYVVFVDFNAPPNHPNLFDGPDAWSLPLAVENAEAGFTDQSPTPVTLYYFTNDPNHWLDPGAVGAAPWYCYTTPSKSAHPFRDNRTLEALAKAMSQWGNIPSHFQEA